MRAALVPDEAADDARCEQAHQDFGDAGVEGFEHEGSGRM
jgi:hypothetical protein